MTFESEDEEFELKRVESVASSHSMRIVLPKKFAEVLQLEKRGYVKITLKNKTIIVEKHVP